MRNNRKNERGQAIVEFALVMPIIILLLLGVVFFAMAFNLQMVLNGAAREGARAWASNRGDTSPCPATAVVSTGTSLTCDPEVTGSGFYKNVRPLVRKYITDNGYSVEGNTLLLPDVLVFNSELTADEWNQKPQSLEDATKVKLTLTYFYKIPFGSTDIPFIALKASCTVKRGS